jgi:serine O-acetyltransferase
MQQSLESTSQTQTAITDSRQNQRPGGSFEPLMSDFRIIFERAPAARSWLEVIFCYPGFMLFVYIVSRTGYTSVKWVLLPV